MQRKILFAWILFRYIEDFDDEPFPERTYLSFNIHTIYLLLPITGRGDKIRIIVTLRNVRSLDSV